jgi:hypothetical protein
MCAQICESRASEPNMLSISRDRIDIGQLLRLLNRSIERRERIRIRSRRNTSCRKRSLDEHAPPHIASLIEGSLK